MRGHQLQERRKEMVERKAQGFTLRATIDILLEKWGDRVSERALYKDWTERKKWIRDVARLADPTLIDEMLQGLQAVLIHAWHEHETNPNPSVKLGSLKLAKDTYKDIIEILQSLGIAVKVPAKLEIIAPWLNKFSSQETVTNPTADS